jgi:serine/threonine protein kinase
MVRAVDFMHTRVELSHGDIKVDNVVITDDYYLAFIDFANCKPIDEKTCEAVGTQIYWAPEMNKQKSSPGEKKRRVISYNVV